MTRSTPEMIAIYDAYPRKVAKPQALRAIARAIDRHGAKVVKDGTIAYAQRAKEVGRETHFIPYPATFFNKEHYNDDLDSLLPKPKASTRHRSIYEIQTIIKAKEEKREALRNKYRHVSPTGNVWHNEEKRLEAVALTKEINTLQEEIAKC